MRLLCPAEESFKFGQAAWLRPKWQTVVGYVGLEITWAQNVVLLTTIPFIKKLDYYDSGQHESQEWQLQAPRAFQISYVSKKCRKQAVSRWSGVIVSNFSKASTPPNVGWGTFGFLCLLAPLQTGDWPAG